MENGHVLSYTGTLIEYTLPIGDGSQVMRFEFASGDEANLFWFLVGQPFQEESSMKKILVMLAVTVIGGAGCADVSDSSASSASISSLSASSTAPAAAPHAYRTDLENTVLLAMHRDTEGTELLRQIGIVAERHGLRDWESIEDTFVAIGEGMREAGVADAKADSVADLVSGGDSLRRQLVLQAYGT